MFPISNTVIRGSPKVQDVEENGSYQNWVDTSYKYRKRITIKAHQVYGNLSNFAVLIHLFDRDLKNIDPDTEINLLFTNENGSQLSHEIETFDYNYNLTHAYLVSWVKINLTNVRDTYISMYYGNLPSKERIEGEDVWDKHYKGVWHLNEIVGTRYDSTYNVIDGNPQNYDKKGAIDGIIARADMFDGIDDFIDTYRSPEELSLGGKSEKTISAWVYTKSYNNGGIFEFGEESAFGYCSLKAQADNETWIGEWGGKKVVSFKYPSSNTWVYFVIKYDGFFIKIFADGQMMVNCSLNLNIGDKIPFRIGRGQNGSFNGSIDEVRISKIARSDNWILTEYQNQRFPESFYSIEEEERDESPPSVVDFGVDDSSDINSVVFFAQLIDDYTSVTNVTLLINNSFVNMSKNSSNIWIFVYSPVFYGCTFYYQVVNASDSFNNFLIDKTEVKKFIFNRDNSPPIVKAAYFIPNTDSNPTNLTFYAKVSENGSGVNEIILEYNFEEVNDSRTGEGAGTDKTYSQSRTVKMTFLNFSDNYQLFTTTIPFSQNDSNWKVIYRISTSDQHGNINENAFSVDSSQAEKDTIIFMKNMTIESLPLDKILPYLFLTSIMTILCFGFLTFLYSRYFKKPSNTVFDENLINRNLNKVTDDAIKNYLNVHTYGVVLAVFEEHIGPIPVLYSPKSLEKDSAMILNLIFRAFSNCDFSPDLKKQNQAFFNFATRKKHMNVLAYTFSLYRSKARNRREHYCVCLLINRVNYPTVIQLTNLLSRRIKKTQRIIDKHQHNQKKILYELSNLREFITRSILTSEKTYKQFKN